MPTVKMSSGGVEFYNKELSADDSMEVAEVQNDVGDEMSTSQSGGAF